ncbi:hypothetical protein BJ970_001828 [Saccharopolyspora phatthalungensis]|uniref:Uncharacterized protein n=1 Tax=Saccharopolyspora phatthalungensis TaxID=664693 RepID=A0A840Q1N2_9PSEU|nr:hypothetical protein [Saccharopolyspora phatthalungensis]
MPEDSSCTTSSQTRPRSAWWSDTALLPSPRSRSPRCGPGAWLPRCSGAGGVTGRWGHTLAGTDPRRCPQSCPQLVYEGTAGRFGDPPWGRCTAAIEVRVPAEAGAPTHRLRIAGGHANKAGPRSQATSRRCREDRDVAALTASRRPRLCVPCCHCVLSYSPPLPERARRCADIPAPCTARCRRWPHGWRLRLTKQGHLDRTVVHRGHRCL